MANEKEIPKIEGSTILDADGRMATLSSTGVPELMANAAAAKKSLGKSKKGS